MLGASIYFSTPLEENERYLKEISLFNVKYIFTSMQIPEEKTEQQLELLKKFISVTNRLGMKLMVDISPETFRKFNVQKEEAIDFLKSLDVRCVRVDYGFDYSEIKAFSNEF
ncbi:MupG family TIM beta-alpha barrel fold protein, partial [Limosilactobacillus fermentum]|uniref:MupG family TIM beta-alpha barrel fold protein n=1 Tax=Limosilactobacillus fermentum TaxID=1613 RepID=UPI0034D45AA2